MTLKNEILKIFMEEKLFFSPKKNTELLAVVPPLGFLWGGQKMLKASILPGGVAEKVECREDFVLLRRMIILGKILQK